MTITAQVSSPRSLILGSDITSITSCVDKVVGSSLNHTIVKHQVYSTNVSTQNKEITVRLLNIEAHRFTSTP